MEVIGKALERTLLAGKLESAAREHERTAASLRRAAAKFRAGSREALGVMVAEDREGVVPRPAGPTPMGSFRSADGER